MTRHPATEGNELHPSDVIIPDPSGGDGRLSVRNDLAAEFAGLAISSTQPTDMPNGGVWVNLSADPTGIDRLQTYDGSTDAFIPISADSTVVSEEQPEPEIGLLWFEPVEEGANLYAANSDTWEFLQFIPAIPDGLVAHYDASEIDAEDGESLSFWSDLSGNDHHLTQIPGDEPTYIENFENGQPAVFTSEDNPIHTNNWSEDYETANTIIWVGVIDTRSSVGRQFIIYGAEENVGDDSHAIGYSDGEYRLNNESSTGGDPRTFNVNTSIFDGGDSVIRQDGEIVSNPSISSEITLSGLNICGRPDQDDSPDDGMWTCELMAFSRRLEPEEYESLESDLMEKYGVS